MKKTLVLGLVGLLAFLVLFFGALPFYLGIKAQDTLTEQNKLLSENAYLEVQSHTYDRGWFSSKEETVIRLKPRFIKPYADMLPENLAAISNSSITIINTVKHGPWAGGAFARANVKTEIVYSPEVSKHLTRFFGEKRPLSMTNHLNLFGGGQLKLSIPAFDYEELSGIKIVWQGLDTGIDYQGNFDAYDVLSKIPGIKIQLADKGEISFNNLYFASHTEESLSKVAIGESQFKLDELKIQWNEALNYDIRLNELLNLLTDLQVGAFINPNGSLKASSVLVKGIEFSTSMDETDQFIDATGGLKFASLQYGKDVYGPLDLLVKASHLEAPSLFALRQRMSAITSSGLPANQLQDAIVAAARKEGLGLFTNNPVFTLERFDLTMPEGQFKATGSMVFNQLNAEDLNSFNAMIAKTDANFTLSSPQRLLESLAEAQASKLFSIDSEMDNAPSNDEIQETARMMVDAMIQGMAREGFLTVEDGQIKTTIQVKNNQLFMNEKAVNSSTTPEDDIDHLTEEVVIASEGIAS